MSGNPGSVTIYYEHDISAIPAMNAGYKHMAYENQKRYMHSDWIGWFSTANNNLAGYAGFLAALTAFLVFALTPGMRMPGFWPFLWLGLTVGLTVWLFLRYWINRHHSMYHAAYVESIMKAEIELAKTVRLDIGPNGLTSTTATDKVFLTWRRYHCSVIEPEHLVLVFEGSVFAVPYLALSQKPDDLAHRINGWVQSSSKPDEFEKV